MMTFTLNKPRILIVEDEVIVARDIKQQLEKLGYEVVAHTTRGDEAITLAGHLRPDLVLMDIQLASEMDGITAAQAIHTQFFIPVVFLTAFAADDLLARIKVTEAFGYILKPFSEQELRPVLEMALYKHQAENKLREAALHTQAILDNMLDGVLTINAKGQIESFNKAAAAMFGYSVNEALGQNVSMLIPEPRRIPFHNNLRHYLSTGEARILGAPRELEALRKDGSVFPINLSATQITRGGEPVFIGLVRDNTQHNKDVEEIRRLAFYDQLTQLPNRRMLFYRLNQAIQTSGRNGHHGALMFLDLDNFKRLNDSQGHDVGDELLQQVAIRLHSCMREGDTVARLGGDEFVVLLEALGDCPTEAATQAETVAHKILKTLGKPYSVRSQTFNSTPSIGIVLFLKDHASMEELIKMADVAMYQAKAAGRNTSRFYDPTMQAAASAHAELEKDMRLGLALNEFELHYQIQVDGKGVTTGAEALVRWNSAKRGLVLPAAFIPMAEETGMILPLGQWVMETACKQLVLWASQPDKAHWTMAVNVSASQLLRPDFATLLADILHKTGANPALLKLELTESMLVHDMENTIIKINAIKESRVSFALDDFGTGYSSLSYLKRLPLDQLKIDQSFVRDVLTNSSDAVIARTVVALGHSLGLKVIAEGVETLGQRDFLANIGCDAFQGFYFGHPGPACDLASIKPMGHA